MRRPTFPFAVVLLPALVARTAVAEEAPLPTPTLPVAATPPAATAPLPAPPPAHARAHRRGTLVHYEPDAPDLWLLSTVGDVNEYVQDYDDVFRRGSSYYHSTGHYVVVCKKACTTHISQNDWPLYLSRGGGEPVEASDFELTGPSVMHATYISRRAQRFSGLGLAIVGVGGGLALAVAGSSGERDNWGLIGAGGAVALAGLGFGAYFGFREDEARIEVVPLGPAEAPASTTPSSPPVSTRSSEGVMLRLRF